MVFFSADLKSSDYYDRRYSATERLFKMDQPAISRTKGSLAFGHANETRKGHWRKLKRLQLLTGIATHNPYA